jgi:hypothetical protein
VDAQHAIRLTRTTKKRMTLTRNLLQPPGACSCVCATHSELCADGPGATEMKSRKVYGFAADWWMLGALMYLLLTGDGAAAAPRARLADGGAPRNRQIAPDLQGCRPPAARTRACNRPVPVVCLCACAPQEKEREPTPLVWPASVGAAVRCVHCVLLPSIQPNRPRQGSGRVAIATQPEAAASRLVALAARRSAARCNAAGLMARAGGSRRGFQQVQKHEFFKKVDWCVLATLTRKGMTLGNRLKMVTVRKKAPYVPARPKWAASDEVGDVAESDQHLRSCTPV